MSIEIRPFGKTTEGEDAQLCILTNRSGMKLAVTTYGAKLVELWAPDRGGRMADVITGFDTLDPYLIRNPYFGAFVGRCANRISGAAFTLNGREYKLDCNKPPHHLHGGQGGLDKKLFHIDSAEGNTLVLSVLSPDGDQGYPGNLKVTLFYTLTDENEVILRYTAETDAPTPVNFTNHSYFNLKGQGEGTVLSHRIRIDADAYVATAAGGIPTGVFQAVEGTPMDLREMVTIGERIHTPYPQLEQDDGFDVSYVLNHPEAGLRSVCLVEEPESGRRMEVRTTLPSMQFYTANFIKGDFTFHGKRGSFYDQHCGLCLETQFHPNTPNTPAFGSITLEPGQMYDQTTVYAFSTDSGN